MLNNLDVFALLMIIAVTLAPFVLSNRYDVSYAPMTPTAIMSKI